MATRKKRTSKKKAPAKANAKQRTPKPEPTKEDQDATKAIKRSQSEQLRLYKERYEPYQAPNGSVSMDNGDDIALILRGASPETVMRAAEKLKGLEPGTLATRYKDRNPGAKRMNSGNQIRALERRGDVTVAVIKKAIKDANAEVNKAS